MLNEDYRLTRPLQWPTKIKVGAVEARIIETPLDKLFKLYLEDLDLTEEELPSLSNSPIAVYDSNEMTIRYRDNVRSDNEDALVRKDLDICHEIIHMWDDLVLANQITLNETNTQSLALALHHLLVQMDEIARGGEDSA